MEQLEQLAELQVRRKFFINAVNRQTNAAKALVRRALGWYAGDDEAKRDKINASAAKIVAVALAGKGCELPAVAADLEVIGQSISPLHAVRHQAELEMRRIARKLLIWQLWAKGVRGLGDLGLAVVLAETNDLALYSNPAKVWKRLGLAPYDGKAASTWRREGGLNSEQWTAIGYSPRRRAEIFSCVGDPLFRQQTIINGPYRQAYDRRRAHTANTHPDWSKGHSHNDALRIMTKELIRDLWVAWRQAGITLEASRCLPAADIFSQEERQANQFVVPSGSMLGANSSSQEDGSAARGSWIANGDVPPPELSALP